MADFALYRFEDGRTHQVARDEDELPALNRLADEVYNALLDHAGSQLTLRSRREGREDLYVSVRIEFGLGANDQSRG